MSTGKTSIIDRFAKNTFN